MTRWPKRHRQHPNNPEDEQYIVRLIGQVIMVSFETVKLGKGLPVLKVG